MRTFDVSGAQVCVGDSSHADLNQGVSSLWFSLVV